MALRPRPEAERFRSAASQHRERAMRELTSSELRVRAIALGLPACVALLVGCGEGRPICRSGADCASGVCQSDGRCEPVSREDAAVEDAFSETTEDAAESDAYIPPGTDAYVDPDQDAGTEEPDAFMVDAARRDVGPIDASSGFCSQNHDGVIERHEVGFIVGASLTMRAATATPVDLTGTTSGGMRHWDFSGPMSNDEDVMLGALPVTGAWYASMFPTASYAARLSVTSENLGVFEVQDGQLLLLGVVSPTDSGIFSRTNLTYDPPVPVLRFPLREGDTWTVRSIASGRAMGSVAAVTENYTFTVDARGALRTPFVSEDFDVLRVRSDLSRTSLGFPIASVRSFAFITECYGTIANVSSQDGETDIEFSTAAEVRRLAP